MYTSLQDIKNKNHRVSAMLSFWHKPRVKHFAKAISLLITLSFVFPYLAWAFEKDTFPAGQGKILFNSQALTIPGKFGAVTKSHQGQDKLIVYIQDLHCHEEVQTNIAGIIDYLGRKYGLEMVGVEGAGSKIDVSKLSGFPQPKVKAEVGKYFMQQGKITGPEYYAAMGKHKIHLEGIETQKYYQANQEGVKRFLNNESQGYVYDLREMLAELKVRVYGKALSKHDRQRNRFREGEQSLLGYAVYLYQAGRRAGLDMGIFSHLGRYVSRRRNILPVNVDSDALYTEMERMERELRLGLYRSEQEQELDDLHYRLDVMEKLVNISIPPGELEAYRGQPEKFRVRGFRDFILSCEAGREVWLDNEVYRLDEYLKEAEIFYQVADQRSLCFVENTLNRMADYQTRLAVLVTGGYHSEEVLKELQRRDISYVCIKPDLRHSDIVNPYFSLLKNRRTPLEKLLAQNQNILSLATCFRTKLRTTAGVENILPENVSAFEKTLDLTLKLGLVVHLMREGVKGLAPLKQAYQDIVAAYRENNSRIGLDWDNVRLAGRMGFCPVTAGFTAVICPCGFQSRNKPLMTVALNQEYEIRMMNSAMATNMQSEVLRAGQGTGGVLTAEMLSLGWHGPMSALVLGGGVAMIAPGLQMLFKGAESGPEPAGISVAGTPDQIGLDPGQEIIVTGADGIYYKYLNPGVLPTGDILPTGDLLARRISIDYDASRQHRSDIVRLHPRDEKGLKFQFEEVIVKDAEDSRIMYIDGKLAMTYVKVGKKGKRWNCHLVFIDEYGHFLTKPIKLGQPGISSKNTHLISLPNGKYALIDRANVKKNETSGIQVYIFNDLKTALHPPQAYWKEHPGKESTILWAAEEWPIIGLGTILPYKEKENFIMAIIHQAKKKDSWHKIYRSVLVLLDTETLQPLGEPVPLHNPDEKAEGDVSGVVYETGAYMLPDGDTIRSYAGWGDSKIARFEESRKVLIQGFWEGQPVKEQTKEVRPNQRWRGKRPPGRQVLLYCLSGILYSPSLSQTGNLRVRMPLEGLVSFFRGALLLVPGTLWLWTITRKAGPGRQAGQTPDIQRLLVEIQADKTAVEIFARQGYGDFIRPNIQVRPCSDLALISRLLSPLGRVRPDENGQPVVHVPDALLLNSRDPGINFFIRIMLKYHLERFYSTSRVDTALTRLRVKPEWPQLVIDRIRQLALGPQGYLAWMLKDDKSILAQQLLNKNSPAGQAYEQWVAEPDRDNTGKWMGLMLGEVEKLGDSQPALESLATLSRLCSRLSGLNGVEVGNLDGHLPKGVSRKIALPAILLQTRYDRRFWLDRLEKLRLPLKLERRELLPLRRQPARALDRAA